MSLKRETNWIFFTITSPSGLMEYQTFGVFTEILSPMRIQELLLAPREENLGVFMDNFTIRLRQTNNNEQVLSSYRTFIFLSKGKSEITSCCMVHQK